MLYRTLLPFTMLVGCSNPCIFCVEIRQLTAAQISSLHWLIRSSCLQSPHLGCCDVELMAHQYTTTLLLHRSPYKTCGCSSNTRSSCRSFAEEESGGNSDYHGGHPHGTADACTEGTGMSHILPKPANGKLKQPMANLLPGMLHQSTSEACLI